MDQQPLHPKSVKYDVETGSAREQGFVLLVVLWVVTSAILLVSSFNAAVRSGAASAVSEVGLSELNVLLNAGLEIAAAHLIDNDEKRRWRGDGTPHSINFSGAELTITITDADGLVDLNKSDGKLLRSLFEQFTKSISKATQYTDVIMQARAAASRDRNAVGSAAAGLPGEGRIPTAAFVDVWQLGRAEGIPREVFDQVAPFLTVYSADGTIYPQTAPRQVLEAIPNLNSADIEKVRYADKAALVDLMAKSPDFLTYKKGAADLVTIRAHRPSENYSAIRTVVVAIGIDPGAPYRVLARWPLTAVVSEKER